MGVDWNIELCMQNRNSHMHNFYDPAKDRFKLDEGFLNVQESVSY